MEPGTPSSAAPIRFPSRSSFWASCGRVVAGVPRTRINKAAFLALLSESVVEVLHPHRANSAIYADLKDHPRAPGNADSFQDQSGKTDLGGVSTHPHL